jgi:hypothetical protein
MATVVVMAAFWSNAFNRFSVPLQMKPPRR